MSDQVNCNKYAMPWPYIQDTQSVNGWTKCEGNTHESVVYVYYGLHNIDCACYFVIWGYSSPSVILYC